MTVEQRLTTPDFGFFEADADNSIAFEVTLISQHPVAGTGVEHASWVSVGAAAKKGGQAFIAQARMEVDAWINQPLQNNASTMQAYTPQANPAL